MDSISKNLITPQSLLIEKTALELAAVFYEAGRSSGLTSKHKDARSFAKANLEKFIPKAIQHLMDMLSNPATPEDFKSLIYEAFMERSNDTDLSNIGIPVFENNTPYLAEKPVIYDQRTIDDILNKGGLDEKKQKVTRN